MRKPDDFTSRWARRAGGLGLAAVAALTLSLLVAPRAQAALLIGAGLQAATPTADASAATEVRFDGRGGHGGGRAFHGGGGAAFHGGGFRGGAPALHGGGFRAAPAFRGGGIRPFHGGGVYRGAGFRHVAPVIAQPSYAPVRHQWRPRHHFRPQYYGYYAPRDYGYAPAYYGPRRFCRIVWTYYGPRKICRTKPWRQHWRHHHRRHHRPVYW